MRQELLSEILAATRVKMWHLFSFSHRRTSVSANDGKWHHICATWENTAGSWKLYKDGKVGAAGKGFQTGTCT